MLTVSTRFKRNQAGQAALMVTLATPFLFAIMGLVIDVGYGYYIKQLAQAAVDSASTAAVLSAQASGGACGSTVLCQTGTVCPANPNSPPVTNFDSACLYAKVNGFPSTGNQQVVLSSGTGSPSANAGLSTAYWIKATATQTNALSFGRIFGFNTAAITATATSGLIPSPGAGGCIFVMDKSASSAFNEGGSGHVQANCGIFVNSSSSSAFNVQGSATLHVSNLSVVGGSVVSNNATVSPTPVIGSSSIDDPLASIPAPTFSGCDYTNLQPKGTVTLSPGVYCGGLKVASGSTVTFNSGTYILNGGGLMVSSANATLTGSGVTFYNTSAGYTFGSIAITGGATVNLTAPTSGTYKGILFFQDRNVNSSATNAIGGGATEYYTGSIYL
ncbi:MAG TPA: TadE/TadG family type IV pilus assembly protein, partial [Bryobacteraceae bacterium]